MKIGSIVQLVDNSNWLYKDEGDIYPVKETNYTIRSVEAFPNGAGILLEEIRNKPRIFNQGLVELHFAAKRFKELLPPLDVVEEIENIKELILE